MAAQVRISVDASPCGLWSDTGTGIEQSSAKREDESMAELGGFRSGKWATMSSFARGLEVIRAFTRQAQHDVEARSPTAPT